MDWTAIGLSLRLSAATTAVLLALGLPLAGWLASTRWRGRYLIDALVALPIVLPPTVLGFYLLLAIGPESPLGRAHKALFGRGLAFSFRGLLLASVLYSLPFAVQPFVAGFSAVDRRYVEASATLGEGRIATFVRVVLPLSWPAVLAGAVLSFAHTVGEFGVVLLVGGNIPGETRTVSVSIYDHVQALDYAAANRTSLAMLGFSFAVLFFVYALQRRFAQAWRAR